jgi:hypothetical protein
MTHLGTKSSTDAQQIVDRISTELGSCHVLLQKLYARLSNTGVLARIWLALSEDKALTAWRTEMGEHRNAIHGLLQSLIMCVLVVIHAPLLTRGMQRSFE